MKNKRSFIYDDYDFSDLVPITKTERPIHPDRENFLAESETVDGAKYIGYKYKNIIIPMRIGLRISDVPEFKRKLAGLIHKDKPKKLIFGNEQDRYYNAVIDGQSEFEEEGHMCHAMIYWLVPDGLAHSIEEKTFTFPEPTYKTQPTKYKKGDTWLVSEDVPVTIKSDFAGKLAGSEVECPHKLLFSAGTSLLNPNQFTAEVSDVHYRLIDTLDNQSWTISSNGIGVMREILIPFDILETVKRAYPFLFDGLGESEQVEKLREIIQAVSINTWAKGSSPTGSRVSLRRHVWATNNYGGASTNITDEIRQVRLEMVTQIQVNQTLNDNGIMPFIVHADPSDGTTPSSVSLDYTDVETSLLLSLKGKLMIATKDSDSFDMTDWELHEKSNVITVENKGTYKTPISIYTKFLTDADTIGFVSDSNLVQLGTAMPPEIETIPPLEQIFNNPLKPQSAKDWQVNVGRIRWRENDPNYQSKRQGSFTWGTEAVSPKDYGPKAQEDQNGYWHGPTLTHYFGQYVDDFDSANRFSFRSPGAAGKRAGAQGLFECNYVDADNNFVMGFEIKDNLGTREHMTCHFFVGDARIPPEIVIPKKAINKDGSFFGSIQMRKTGSEFFFRLTGLKLVNGKLVETWALQKRIFNETVAMLSVARLDTWFSQWKNTPTMAINFSDSKFWKLNTIDLSAIPNYFYKNDEVEVDGYSNRVLLNGIQTNDYRVLGSDQIFWAEPGKTYLHVTTSGLVDVELSLRERFL